MISAPPIIDRLEMTDLGRLVAPGSEDRETDRVIWPVVVGYHDAGRILIGWCERRQDFRNFRIDRVISATFLDQRFPARPSALRATWLASLKEGGRNVAENADTT
jgi:predicted DNA-binding transcriptional regulator YafY